jgi:hypothetical protein
MLHLTRCLKPYYNDTFTFFCLPPLPHPGYMDLAPSTNPPLLLLQAHLLKHSLLSSVGRIGGQLKKQILAEVKKIFSAAL